MGIEGPPTGARALAVAITSGQAEDFGERWAAWQAGVAHERAIRRNVAIALPTLIVVAAIVAYKLLGR